MATRSNTTQAQQPVHPQLSRDNVKTRLVKDGDVTTSNVTVIFDDEGITREFALRAAVIAWQAICRDAGVIPATETLTISELKKRSGERGGFGKATPDSIAAKVNKLDETEYRAILVKLGVPAREVERLVKARMSKA